MQPNQTKLRFAFALGWLLLAASWWIPPSGLTDPMRGFGLGLIVVIGIRLLQKSKRAS
ncbi:MAG: hypothetical protein WCE44_03750 [Candidatus Velthaea sp.]